MISESNAQKTRYEMEDDPKGGKRIRAISKSRRNAFARELREKEKKEREKKREEEAREQQRERETLRRDPERPEQRDERSERSERSERWDGREAREAREPRREDGRWWGETWQEGPTYEQQVREGFLPVWQGSRLVAMAKEHQTVRPGRRANAYGGKGFEGKGEHAKGDKGDGKGYDFKNEAKGERKGRGKDEKGKEGKGKFEGKGFHMDSRGKGDGFKPEGFRHEGKEEEQHEVKADRYGRGSRQQRWRAVNDRDIIVRVGLGMETDIVGTLLAGSLVTQVGEDKIVKNGIARMFIESIEPNAGIKGWVTRSAEAAGGPVFFKPDRGNVRGEPRGKEGKVGKGSQFGGEKGEKGKTDSKGKGRRPVGEGETAGGRLDQPDDQQPPPVVASAESS
ncbi:unnamed protein product [Durusdinium trenchii]|uniref:Uncharacterized protein n=2 Tax=Durusdinium trenchii TaxID=1381693 RepID=A0ABP0KHK7_9DINO